MADWSQLMRAYEARHFPPGRRLDLQGEGPDTARRRALRWIQTFAHEEPGPELLLIVERGRPAGARPTLLRRAVERMLDDLSGTLLDGWSAFGDGSLAVRVSADPRMRRRGEPPPPAAGEGRTEATAGAAFVEVEDDIPGELLPMAQRAAELRRAREGLPVGLTDTVLRRLWIEAQAAAMTEGTGWEDALAAILSDEEARLYDED